MVDLVCVLVLVLVLGFLPQEAKELQKLRSLRFKAAAQNNVDTLLAKIAASKEKTEKLAALFPDENGLINFAKEIDQLKKEGIVTHFSFASNKVVQDKTGFTGLPIIIEFRGSNDQVERGLKKVQQLPFLIRAIDIDIKTQPGEDRVILKYGGILYVEEIFSKD